VPLTRPSFGDEELAAVRDVLASGWVAGQGPRGAELEDLLREHTGRRHAVAVSNCTAGLHLTLDALGVGPGDEVVVPDYTYPATAMAVLHCGATPVMVDVEQDTGCLDPELVPAAITPRTRAVMGVDSLGLCADWDALQQVADAHAVPLVEDAACSLGATYEGRPAGSFGRVAVFSLHARKGATSGEGGVVVTDDDELASRVRRRSCFGQRSALVREGVDQFTAPSFDELGWNYKLSDVQAAIAVVQVTKIAQLVSRRQMAARRYEASIDLEGVALPQVPDGRTHSWQTYAVTLDRSLDRDTLVTDLRRQGIGSTMGTFDLRSQPVFGGVVDETSTAQFLARHQLALPMFSDITSEEQERVSRALGQAVSRARH
jgi:perosamine synthetase